VKGRREKGIFSGRLRKIKREREVFQVKAFPVKGRGENGILFREKGRARGVFRRRAFQGRGEGRTGYFSGSKGEREVFSGEGFPRKEERGERNIFQGD
jgi:hypothetical protein